MEKIIECFGKSLMKNVRDRSINQMELRINGKMMDEDSKDIYLKIEKLGREEKELIEEIIPQIVDITLHNMLFMIEEEEEIKLMVGNQELKEASDGLCGELYSEDGWIKKFSKK